MTREQKLALILGFALTLAVTVLISDHFSNPDREFGEVAITPELLSPRSEVVLEAAGGDRETPTTLTETGTRFTEPKPQEPYVFNTGDRNDSSIRDLLSNNRRATEDAEDQVAPPRRDTTRVPPEPRTPQRHQIAPRDTLSAIAAHYYGDASLTNALADYNIRQGFLKNRDIIRVGATILIPDRTELGAPAGDTPKTPTRAAPRTYKVQPRDTAWGIAAKLLGDGNRWKDIADLNPGVDLNRLTVGTTIKVPGS